MCTHSNTRSRHVYDPQVAGRPECSLNASYPGRSVRWIQRSECDWAGGRERGHWQVWLCPRNAAFVALTSVTVYSTVSDRLEPPRLEMDKHGCCSYTARVPATPSLLKISPDAMPLGLTWKSCFIVINHVSGTHRNSLCVFCTQDLSFES
jgi:hypothetical protein